MLNNLNNHNTIAVTAKYPDGEESEPVELLLSLSGVKSIDIFGNDPVDVYDVTGRLVASQVRSSDGLSAGVYVINGAKFIVK